MKIKFILYAVLCGFIAACAGGSKEVPKPDPTPIGEFESKVEFRENWSSTGSSRTGLSYVQLMPAIADGRIYTVSFEGVVTALDADSGELLWTRALNESISAGVGAGDQLLSVVTSNGKVIVLATENGETVWENLIGRAVLAPPLFYRGSVLVRTIDGKLYALGQDRGVEAWSIDVEQPNFTMQGSTPPSPLERDVVIGTSSGQIQATDVATGIQSWILDVLPPGSITSASESLRVADTKPVIFRDGMYVAIYDFGVTAIDLNTGNQLWDIQRNSRDKIDVNSIGLFGIDLDDRVYALDRFNGDELWAQEAFLYREITNIAVAGNYVVTTDRLGVIHATDVGSGEVAGVLNKNDVIPPGSLQVADDRLYIHYQSGKIASVSLVPIN